MSQKEKAQIDALPVQKSKASNHLVWITLGLFLIFLAFGILPVWVFCGGLEEWQEKDSHSSKCSVSVLLGVPDTVAVVGKLFSYHVPDSAFQGTILSIQARLAGSSVLPHWLFFDEASFTFLGVPAPDDLGAFMIEIDAFSSATEKGARTSFLIQVKQTNQVADNTLYATDSQRNIVCDWDEQTIKASILLDASISTLTPSDRVTVLNKWSDHLSLSIAALTLGPKPEGIFDKLSGRKILIAGPGDASLSTSNKGVELTWTIACGEFRQKQEIESILIRNIERGYIRLVLGYHVIGWYVTETLPLSGHVASLRKKRQVQGFQTPLVTPTISTTKPTALPSFTVVTVEPTVSASFPVSSSIYMSSIPPNTTDSTVPKMTTTSTIMTSINVTESVTSARENTTFSIPMNLTMDVTEETPSLPTDFVSSQGINTSPPSTTMLVTNSSLNTTDYTTSEGPLNTTDATTLEGSVNITDTTTTEGSVNTTTVSSLEPSITENVTTDGDFTTVVIRNVTVEVTTPTVVNVTGTMGDNATSSNLTTQISENITSVTEGLENTTKITGQVTTSLPVNVTHVPGTNGTTSHDITTNMPTNTTETPDYTVNQTVFTTQNPTNTSDVTNATMSSNFTTVIPTNATDVTSEVTTQIPSNITTVTDSLTNITSLGNLTTDIPTSITTATDSLTNSTIFSNITTDLPINISTVSVTNGTEVTTVLVTDVTNITVGSVVTTEIPVNETEAGNNTTQAITVESTTQMSTFNIVTEVSNITTPLSNITTEVSNITTEEPAITTVENNLTTDGIVNVTTKSTVDAVTSVGLTSPFVNLTTEGMPVTTAPGQENTTVVEPTTPTTSLTTQPGIPPSVNWTIDYIQTYLGVHFGYLIPEYTFTDSVYGDTRNLSLQLERVNPDGGTSQIDPDNWVQFNVSSQVIYGLPLQYDYITEDIHRVKLTARNPRDLSSNLTIVMNINGTNVENISFVFILEIILDSLTLENNASIPYTTDDVIHAVHTIGRYYGDPDATWVTLIDIINNDGASVTFKWTNNSISKTVCQNDTIKELYSSISENGNLVEMSKYFLPRYSIKSTGVEWLGVCLTEDSEMQGSSADSNLFLAIFLPILFVILLIIIIICIFCCLRKRGKKAGRYIPEDEKPIYSKNRKPIFMAGELEMDDSKKPRKPTIMDIDNRPPHAYSNPSYIGPVSRRPPPPYASNPELREMAQPVSTDPYSPEEPVAYGGEMQMPVDYEPYLRHQTPPPAYRLPPPYLENPGYSQI